MLFPPWTLGSAHHWLAYDVEVVHDILWNAEQLDKQGLIEGLPVGVVVTLVGRQKLHVAEPLEQRPRALRISRFVEFSRVNYEE